MSAYLLRKSGFSEGSYSTSFPATENPLNQGGRWRVGTVTGYYGTPRTTPGKCFANTTVTPGELDDNLAQLLSPNISANCRVTVTVSKSTGSKTDSFEFGIYGRMSIGAQFVRGYEVLIGFNPSEFQVVKWLGVATTFPANFTVLSTSGIPAAVNDGDVFHVDFIGNVIIATACFSTPPPTAAHRGLTVRQAWAFS